MKKAFVSWEIFRLPFNLVLLTFGLFWCWPLRQTMVNEAWFGYWGSVFAYGFTANVFYTLGPAAEAYLFAFRGHGFNRGRGLLMALGLAISILMTWIFIWSMEILYVVLYPSRR